MKRLDFSFHNDSGSSTDAVQKITFTAPIDIVGKARISRFKVSQGTFPLCTIPPMQTYYTTSQKTRIDQFGCTPLDLYVACTVQKHADNSPALTNSYIFTQAEGGHPLFLQPASGNYAPSLGKLITFYSYERPVWKQNSNGWKLANKDIFLYSFNDLFDERKFRIQTDNYPSQVPTGSTIPEIKIRQYGSKVIFDLISLQQQPGSAYWIAPPHLTLSKTFMSLFGYNNSPFVNISEGIFSGIGWSGNCPLYYDAFDYEYSKEIESALGRWGPIVTMGARPTDYSSRCTFELPTDFSKLFPYTGLVVMIDEFNNPGERIVVNNTASSGVVNLSTLSISKLFLLGHTNSERSDFVYVDDSMNQTPLIVNLPKQLTLTIRLYFLLRDNSLVPLKIPINENFFLQLTITE